MRARQRLTPQTFEYEENVINHGREVNWMPYLMYFQPGRHESAVVNTDPWGFRYSYRGGQRYSVGDHEGIESARLIVGSSTVFGIGASTDRWTLSSCLSERDQRGAPWLNFGALAFNSVQELVLLTLYRHLLPRIEEIVLFTGFNNLVLARLPADERLLHGAFFNCNPWFQMVKETNEGGGSDLRGLFRRTPEPVPAAHPSAQEQIAKAAGLTLRHLDGWRALAADLGAKLTFVLQPTAVWVRDRGSREEEELFAEFNQLGNFLQIYGDILTRGACSCYAAQLLEGARQMGVRFINFSPLLAEVAQPDEWLFVDRIHFTDHGHEVVSRILLELLEGQS